MLAKFELLTMVNKIEHIWILKANG